MEITGIPNVAVSNNKKEDPLSLKKAIKAYQDEIITGLTDEEKAEIERQAKEYLNKNPLKTKQDREAFNEFIKSLIKKFGFKGDVDEMVAGIVNTTADSAKASEQQISVENHFQKETMGVMSAKNKINSVG